MKDVEFIAMNNEHSLRIAVFFTDAYGGIGGIAKFNRDLLDSLSLMSEVSEIIAVPRLVRGDIGEIPRRICFDMKAARGKLKYILRSIKYSFANYKIDIVFCGHINLLPIAWFVSRLHHCPLVIIVHGIEAWRPHQSFLVRRLLPGVDAILAVSSHTVKRVQAWSGLPASKFYLLPNSIDLEKYVPRPRNEALAAKYGLVGKRVLLTVGRLAKEERYKGFDEVIEVLPYLAREIPQITYLIVGDGDDRVRLETKARRLGVENRVIFVGYVSEEEKIDLYNLADVFVMPGRGEGFGIVYLEAMACGVPVIGSLLDGSHDALRGGTLGQLVDPDDPQQIMAAIHKALAVPRGRPAGLEYFSIQAYRKRLVKIVHEFVGALP